MSKLYAIRQTGNSNYWYDFVEDFTSAELDEHCVSNDLVYVKECQNNLSDLNPAWKNCEIVELGIVADLEAKLAESKEAIKYLKGIKRYDIGEMLTENAKLKQQLAEKDAEILKISEYFGKVTFELRELCNKKDQDKISFAVEKLEKVKEFILKNSKSMIAESIDDSDFGSNYVSQFVFLNDISDQLDKQIKQLKEKK